MTSYENLPDDLPAPRDDGAARHLPGMAMPKLALTATDGRPVDLSALGEGRTVLYLYPLSGKPGTALPDGWDAIPGARGCTPEACGFRDHIQELREAGAERVYGLSAQDTGYQREFAERMSLPFAILSDPELRLGELLGLPAFEAAGKRLYARLTMIVLDGLIEHVFYPVFPPDRHADEVLQWLHAHPRPAPAARELVIDLGHAAAGVTDAYANFALTTVDDHVVRMSVMTEPFYWHRHPDGDETFLVLEGTLLLQTAHERIELRPGQLYTVPAGLAHTTSPLTERSVNLTFERIGMSTERVDAPDRPVDATR
jgi:peroxiredoxin/mannose-6-phosphate isomerase-like protein (cupin superfamily)